MKYLYTLVPIIVFLLNACVNDDYFGQSPHGNINNIEISNQASQAQIDAGNKIVNVDFPPGVNLDSCTIQVLQLSSFAESDHKVGDVLDLTKNAEITVTAEDGTSYTWEIHPYVASSTPQLDNSDFNLWYQTPDGYLEPGADASSSIWGTGNPGTQILGLTATTPFEVASDNMAVRMETLYNGKLAETFGTPISAGSIFTGLFDKDAIDPSDPEAAISFGTPFAGRPLTFKLNYSYVPGEENKDKNGTSLADEDQCDIYILLEIRNPGSVERLATAWFRSSVNQTEYRTIEIPFAYGPLDSSFPKYMFPESGNFVSADSASFVLPTHITFVASSSYDGANFAGAVGSILYIDDLELIYE